MENPDICTIIKHTLLALGAPLSKVESVKIKKAPNQQLGA
ncbi:hypothetical protein VCRA2119O147_1160004 [Vibrio crassostreae]|uniref:Uncharacterized protein n=1 Tax=Vibrio crassostreae TaxID=246167 RepID=A0A822MV77_9VIBR|nr:hypothetical protein VCRA2119O245_100005 [Vibrio crassostreae]CDT73950.1 hypothetical protein VCR15J2_50207 [Vibrio coralliirubri]CAK1694126.1 hypothetical protein VCRA2110O173_100019 [Vibrio crassostreae]CAK1720724.1 hypothetical protein VCRA2116O233_120006 [Vibrio crassostreae]CAK1724392.1 hypothetical protein VCRA2112E186_120005 [Vibrio crassostreae]